MNNFFFANITHLNSCFNFSTSSGNYQLKAKPAANAKCCFASRNLLIPLLSTAITTTVNINSI